MLVSSVPVRLNQGFTPLMVEPILPQIAAGRLGAVDDCIQRYSAVLWSLARRSLANTHDAEDAVQEIFLELWKNAGRFDPSLSSEPTFVTTIARRRLIDRSRKRSRRPAPQILDEPERIEGEPESDSAEIADEARKVSAALGKLRPEQKQILEMALVEGHSQQEISNKTGMPLGTVKSHARRGLMRVRELLGVKRQEVTREAEQ
jgi:RNA polymerase sigma-70 factor (ECF subfamily)